MALTYDSAECVLELQTKESVRSAVVAGWRRVGDACLPQPSPHTPGAPAPSTPSYMLHTFPPLPPINIHSTATSSNNPPTLNLTTNTDKTRDLEEQWVIHLKTRSCIGGHPPSSSLSAVNGCAEIRSHPNGMRSLSLAWVLTQSTSSRARGAAFDVTVHAEAAQWDTAYDLPAMPELRFRDMVWLCRCRPWASAFGYCDLHRPGALCSTAQRVPSGGSQIL